MAEEKGICSQSHTHMLLGELNYTMGIFIKKKKIRENL